jgi:hypothetical protein
MRCLTYCVVQVTIYKQDVRVANAISKVKLDTFLDFQKHYFVSLCYYNPLQSSSHLKEGRAQRACGSLCNIHRPILHLLAQLRELLTQHSCTHPESSCGYQLPDVWYCRCLELHLLLPAVSESTSVANNPASTM